MEERIKIKYVSDRQGIVSWIDEVLRKRAKEEGYEFIGSGMLLPTNERDLEFRKIIKVAN